MGADRTLRNAIRPPGPEALNPNSPRREAGAPEEVMKPRIRTLAETELTDAEYRAGFDKWPSTGTHEIIYELQIPKDENDEEPDITILRFAFEAKGHGEAWSTTGKAGREVIDLHGQRTTAAGAVLAMMMLGVIPTDRTWYEITEKDIKEAQDQYMWDLDTE